MISKQEKEGRYFKLFTKEYRLPDGAQVFYDEDKPDISFKLVDGTHIGVEVTNAYKDGGKSKGNESAQAKLRKEITEQTEHIYRKKGKCNLKVFFGFNDLVGLNPKRRKDLPTELYKLVKKFEQYEGNLLYQNIFPEFDFRDHFPEIYFVYILQDVDENRFWEVKQCYDRPLCNPEFISQVIKDKEEKSVEYRKMTCYWLLIVIDFFDPAQDQEIGNLDNFRFSSNIFEKIFLFQTCFNKIIEIMK